MDSWIDGTSRQVLNMKFRFLAILVALCVFRCENSLAGGEDVIAAVGRFAITKQDLLDSYEFGPAFVKRLPDPLRKHLDFMIAERLLALQAEELKYDTTAFVRERVSALDEDLTVDELYKDEVLSKVELSDREIETGIQKAKTNLRLRWIFYSQKQRVEQLSQQLKSGASFDSLYNLQLDSASDKRLETTLLRLESDVPEFAHGIRTLRPKQVSAPLQGPDGYYLVRIDQVWQNPLTTETEYEKLKHEAVEVLRTSKADELGREYVKSKMKSANPVIKAEGFNIVRAYLADKGLSRDTQVKWKIPATFMTEAGPMPIDASDKFLKRPLVTFAGQTLNVRDYVRWFDVRQFQLKRSSLAAFNSSVKQTIWKMVQDKMLSQEAYGRGLNKRQEVRHEAKKWEAKLLYLAGRSHVMRSISISDSMLRQHYQLEKKRYRDANEKQLTFEKARDQVRLDVYFDAETKTLFRTLQQLRKKYEVVINEDMLTQLSAQVSREPSAIDVKFYKPGGTFPRVAFPSIDERWQSLTR
jgi:hypothetical protein